MRTRRVLYPRQHILALQDIICQGPLVFVVLQLEKIHQARRYMAQHQIKTQVAKQRVMPPQGHTQMTLVHLHFPHNVITQTNTQLYVPY